MSQGEPMTPTPHSPNIAATNPSNVGGQENQTQQQSQQQPQQQGQSNVQSQNSTQQQTQQKREINTAMVCMIGQVCIHEIVTRTCEVFGYLRQLQPPLGSQNNGKSN